MSSPCRLEIGDTADWKSALPGRSIFLRRMRIRRARVRSCGRRGEQLGAARWTGPMALVVRHSNGHITSGAVAGVIGAFDGDGINPTVTRSGTFGPQLKSQR